MARQYGLKKLAVPSAGNAASALAAYCAAAGIEAHIFMPKDVPLANLVECKAYGAHVTLVNGLISDCAKMVNERKQAEGWFDISTLKEPFRVEGKKTMGYEVAEQLNWELPDAIFYPTGGGVGLIGMWKAFDEMEQLGWLKTSGGKRPKMIAVQASGCAPVVSAWNEHKPVAGCGKTRTPSPPGCACPSHTPTTLFSISSSRAAAPPLPSPTSISCRPYRTGPAVKASCCARRRGLTGRLQISAGAEIPETHRQSGPLQHRLRTEVH